MGKFLKVEIIQINIIGEKSYYIYFLIITLLAMTQRIQNHLLRLLSLVIYD